MPPPECPFLKNFVFLSGYADRNRHFECLYTFRKSPSTIYDGREAKIHTALEENFLMSPKADIKHHFWLSR